MSIPPAHIRLRPVTLSDVDAILGWINDPEITRNFAGFQQNVTREDELAFLTRMRASQTDRLYAITREDDVAIGTAGIHNIYAPAGNARLGLMLGRHRGHGLGRAALTELVGRAFHELHLHKVWIIHFADNARMSHLCARLGFQVEGLLRDEYFHRGRHWDMVRQSLLAHEFPRPQDAHVGPGGPRSRDITCP
jgi:RimJ/RimL family protein N-acetyltransferase